MNNNKKVSELPPAAVDVLIIGYGPVGATIAALLGRYGVTTLVLDKVHDVVLICLLYTSPSPRDRQKSRMPSSA